jgi:hypothetical protein
VHLVTKLLGDRRQSAPLEKLARVCPLRAMLEEGSEQVAKARPVEDQEEALFCWLGGLPDMRFSLSENSQSMPLLEAHFAK